MMTMNWNTIYITGNDNFWEDVNKRLSNSDLNFLTGYIEQQPDGKYNGLYWLDSKVDLKQFKEAIGGKVVWKYRLNFFNELSQPKNTEGNSAEPNTFSEKENAMIKAMRKKKTFQIWWPGPFGITKQLNIYPVFGELREELLLLQPI